MCVDDGEGRSILAPVLHIGHVAALGTPRTPQHPVPAFEVAVDGISLSARPEQTAVLPHLSALLTPQTASPPAAAMGITLSSGGGPSDKDVPTPPRPMSESMPSLNVSLRVGSVHALVASALGDDDDGISGTSCSSAGSQGEGEASGSSTSTAAVVEILMTDLRLGLNSIGGSPDAAASSTGGLQQARSEGPSLDLAWRSLTLHEARARDFCDEAEERPKKEGAEVKRSPVQGISPCSGRRLDPMSIPSVREVVRRNAAIRRKYRRQQRLRAPAKGVLGGNVVHSNPNASAAPDRGMSTAVDISPSARGPPPIRGGDDESDAGADEVGLPLIAGLPRFPGHQRHGSAGGQSLRLSAALLAIANESAAAWIPQPSVGGGGIREFSPARPGGLLSRTRTLASRNQMQRESFAGRSPPAASVGGSVSALYSSYRETDYGALGMSGALGMQVRADISSNRNHPIHV